jgi:hypothetical protein
VKVIIAGSRTLKHHDENAKQIDALIKLLPAPVSEVVSGTARGVDTSGALWAQAHGVPVRTFPADWKRYGKKAGAIRNRAMAEYADVLLLIWTGGSPGSQNMFKAAMGEGLLILEYVQPLGEVHAFNFPHGKGAQHAART